MARETMGRTGLMGSLEAVGRAAARAGRAEGEWVLLAGGSALILSGRVMREVTKDADVLECSPGMVSILAGFPEIDTNVAAFSCNVPENYSDRAQPLVRLETGLYVYALAVEDIAVMKLYSHRTGDEADLRDPAFLEGLDWSVLDRLVYDRSEAWASHLSDFEYAQMCRRYEDYRAECAPGFVPDRTTYDLVVRDDFSYIPIELREQPSWGRVAGQER